MTGLAGFLAWDNACDPRAVVTAMSARLGDGTRSVPQEVAGTGGGALAHAAFRTTCHGPSVARNRDGTVLCVVDGYLAAPGLTGSPDCSRTQDSPTAAEVAIHLYEEEGERFPARLQGSFSLAVWDARRHRALLATDLLGLRPLFYRARPDRFAFASAVRALLADGSRPGPVDEVTLGEFLVLGIPLGSRTFFTDVRLVPAGSTVLISAERRRPEVRRHSRVRYEPASGPSLSPKAWAEQGTAAFVEAVHALTAGVPRVDVPLSGGLDSRCIVATLHRLGVPVRTHTLGSSGASDVRLATAVADRLGIPHTAWIVKPEDSVLWARAGAYLTDGMFPAFDAHILWIAHHLPEDAQLVLDGASSLDGYFRRYRLPWRFTAGRARPSPVQIIRTMCTQPLFDEEGRLVDEGLFRTSFRAAAEAHLRRRLQELVQSLPPDLAEPYDVLDFLDLTQRVRRYNTLGAHLLRSRVETYQPFFHPSMFTDFVCRLPARLRGADKPVLAEMIHQIAPELSDIPYERTGLPPRAGSLRLTTRLAGRALHRVAGRVAPRLFPRPCGTAIDYAGWLRQDRELQDFVRDLLLCPTALARGHLDQAGVHRLVEDQLSGQRNRLALISRLVSVELWYRTFVDGQPEKKSLNIPPCEHPVSVS